MLFGNTDKYTFIAIDAKVYDLQATEYDTCIVTHPSEEPDSKFFIILSPHRYNRV